MKEYSYHSSAHLDDPSEESMTREFFWNWQPNEPWRLDCAEIVHCRQSPHRIGATEILIHAKDLSEQSSFGLSGLLRAISHRSVSSMQPKFDDPPFQVFQTKKKSSPPGYEGRENWKQPLGAMWLDAVPKSASFLVVCLSNTLHEIRTNVKIWKYFIKL